MVPMPENPKVVVQVDPNGVVEVAKSNIPGLVLQTETDHKEYQNNAQGMPYDVEVVS